MTDKKKTLLNEGTVRRFMALAGVESLVNPFLDRVNEGGFVGDTFGGTPGAVPDAGGTPDAVPDATATPNLAEAEELEEGEELEEVRFTDKLKTQETDDDDMPSREAPGTGRFDVPIAQSLPTGKRKKADTAKDPLQFMKNLARKNVGALGSGPGAKEKVAQVNESLTSRTLAESILRHIPNLEIVDDESTFKTTRQSDILEEVLRRVKKKLS
jgi:hypothetical protein